MSRASSRTGPTGPANPDRPMPLPPPPAEHGYGPYTRGCRCDECRDAKRFYQQGLRAERRRSLTLIKAHGDQRGYHVVAGIKHGYAGYVEHFCRCEVCRAAKSAQWRSEPSGGGKTRRRLLAVAADRPGSGDGYPLAAPQRDG